MRENASSWGQLLGHNEVAVCFRRGEIPYLLSFTGVISYRCFKGCPKYFWRPIKSTHEISPVKQHLGHFGPPDMYYLARNPDMLRCYAEISVLPSSYDNNMRETRRWLEPPCE